MSNFNGFTGDSDSVYYDRSASKPQEVKLDVTAYIKQLESLIAEGEELRDKMRSASASKDAVIRRQAGELKHLQNINEVFRQRRNNAAKRLREARQQARVMKDKLEILSNRYEAQERFISGIKAIAKQIGVWSQLVEKSKEGEEK
ncbi:hypothetical protein FMK81_28170 [Klebsiella oxytoca]|uniref:hypothetical protein n=1 Tax=Klebsiella oxytoca TaxID=571 RepID=UPI001CCA43D9|nr:hypothetical protein [Klebsiella oxytoca]MBZ7265329.1 hypothetical protein [Klebsiella oxytoca]MCW9548043.1 hypothetical protein [Klebsiella oxytoca]